MPYSPTYPAGFRDLPDTSTPITAAALNTIDAGITSVTTQTDLFTAPWTGFTPLLTAVTTNPTLGSGSSQSGRYVVIGKTVIVDVRIAFGTGASAGSGAYSISLPVTAANVNCLIGNWFGQDQSSGARQTGLMFTGSTTQASLTYTAASGFPLVGNSTPWTWSNSDLIWASMTYEAA